MLPEVFTYHDAIGAAEDFLIGAGGGAHKGITRRAVQAAYREIVASHDWTFLNGNGRIQLVAPQTTGTVVYTSSTRVLTLTGATWPADAQDYSVRFDDIVCDVESRTSDTVIVLDSVMAPGADVASTTYSMYPRWYLLPNDFASMGPTFEENASRIIGRQISPAEMLGLDRYRDTTGNVQFFAVGPAPDLHGTMALYLHPASDMAETLDFPYKRRSRPLRYTGWGQSQKQGTISLTAGSAVVTGTDTAFESGMVGAIFRSSSSTSIQPEGIAGDHPWAEQRSILTFTSTTSITLDAAVTTSRSGVKYVISDPIDLDVAVFDAFLRCVDKQLARAKQMKNRAQIEKAAAEALFIAKNADHRVNHNRQAATTTPYFTRLAYSSSRPEI